MRLAPNSYLNDSLIGVSLNSSNRGNTMPDPFVYAIQEDGKLLWYSHDGRTNGRFNWQGPNEVGTGWNGFSTVFSGGEGVIYAIQEASRDLRTGQRTGGHLLWYRHDGRSDGTSNWHGPKTVGNG